MEEQLWAVVETSAYEYGCTLAGILRGSREEVAQHLLQIAEKQANQLDSKSWPHRVVSIDHDWPEGGFTVELNLGQATSNYWEAQPFAPVDACASP